ncbi:hypothetical protein [Desmospora profundinema]|uniref:Secreted protein n=1 Tax=Desmospora profundinema TaxID=1571184 RepID=A0ABU1IMT6_9BACL|nr:hypothetical protein [Desmospora profundinema]MDR6226096.1 hypothetical protein [Desmospora profundinema]
MSAWRVLSPLGMLGYGYPLSSLRAGLKRNPHVIAVDAGSTRGPHRLDHSILWYPHTGTRGFCFPSTDCPPIGECSLTHGS